MTLGQVVEGAVRQYHVGAFRSWLVALASKNPGEAPQRIGCSIANVASQRPEFGSFRDGGLVERVR